VGRVWHDLLFRTFFWGSLLTVFISQPQNQNHFKNKLNRLYFTSITFKKEILWKLENYVPTNAKTIVKNQNPIIHGGKVDVRQQVTLYCQETTVYFSMSIDRTRVSSGIVRALRDVWRTINCVVFVTDEQSVFLLCPEEDRQTCLSLSRTMHCENHEHVSSNDFPFPCL
jgi:hypothetical protein